MQLDPLWEITPGRVFVALVISWLLNIISYGYDMLSSLACRVPPGFRDLNVSPVPHGSFEKPYSWWMVRTELLTV